MDTVSNQEAVLYTGYSTTYGPYDGLMAGDKSQLITLGGLTIEAWQIIIWGIAAAVIGGVFIVMLMAITHYRRQVDDMGRRPTYTESSIAMIREDMLARYKAQDLMKKWRRQSLEMSKLEQQFHASKRGGRCDAIIDLSMACEAGSRQSDDDSVRSGVTNISTPKHSDEEEYGRHNQRWTTPRKSESMVVEIGDYGRADAKSVKSGVSYVLTPRGSQRQLVLEDV